MAGSILVLIWSALEVSADGALNLVSQKRRTMRSKDKMKYPHSLCQRLN
jgi:hypothetical protein